MCRRELVIDATAADDESVVGDECHIISGQSQGPRYEPGFPAERLDEPENLILLCRVHHKMVDDQCETYTGVLLTELKQNHEKWVSATLEGNTQPPPVRVRRIKNNIPSHLVRVTTGKDIMRIVGGACAFSFEHDEPQSEMERDLLGGFLQEAQDWGDLSGDLEAGDRVNAAYRLSTVLRELEDAGFWVFAAREIQQMEGGIGHPSAWPVAILRVNRKTNPDIHKVKLPDPDEVNTEQR